MNAQPSSRLLDDIDRFSRGAPKATALLDQSIPAKSTPVGPHLSAVSRTLPRAETALDSFSTRHCDPAQGSDPIEIP